MLSSTEKILSVVVLALTLAVGFLPNAVQFSNG